MTQESTQKISPDEKVILDSLEALKVYFDPMRIQIVQEVAGESKTVHEIAEALDVPFTRLYYHIKMLEKHNIIRVVDVKAMSGAVEEKYYQVTACMFVVDRSLLTVVDDGDQYPGLEVLLSAMIDETSTDIRRSVRHQIIDLQQESPHPESLLARRGVLRLSREDAQALHEELLEVMSRYGKKDPGRDGAYYALQVALYPTDVSTEPDESDMPDD